jgi:hypothetical protein
MTTDTNSIIHQVSPQLIKAYRQASYVVFGDDSEFVLKVGKVSQELVTIMKNNNVNSAAFLTAYNPHSQQLELTVNEQSQAKLFRELQSLKINYLQGEGRDDSGEWLAESSVLALGISLQNAEILAEQFKQNAFVWINNLDGLVSLRLCHPIAILTLKEINQWISELPQELQEFAKPLPNSELAWLMSVPKQEVEHWLNSKTWDLNAPWPLARPDGSAMGIGTELDRVFRLIQAGVQRYY